MNSSTARTIGQASWFGVVTLSCLAIACASTEQNAIAKKTTITYSGWLTTRGDDDIIKAFSKKHPDIVVKNEPLRDVPKLLTMWSAGLGPDVVVLGGVDAKMAAKYRGLTRNLSPYVRASKTMRLDNFRGGFQDDYRRPDGSIYALPWGAGITVAYYNEPVLAAAGLKPPRRGWTLDDFQTYASKMTRDTDGDGRPNYYGNGWNGMFELWAAAFGSTLVDPATSKALIDSPKVIDAWGALLRFSDLKVTANQWGVSGPAEEAFAKGNIGMFMDLEGRIPTYLSTKLHEKFKWNIVDLPVGPGGPFTYGWGNLIGISAASKKPREAWTFLEYYMSDDAQTILASRCCYPITRSALKDERGRNPFYPELNTSVFTTTDRLFSPPFVTIPGWPIVEPLWGSASAAVWSRKQDAAIAMKKLAPQMTKLLQDARRKFEKLK